MFYSERIFLVRVGENRALFVLNCETVAVGMAIFQLSNHVLPSYKTVLFNGIHNLLIYLVLMFFLPSFNLFLRQSSQQSIFITILAFRLMPGRFFRSKQALDFLPTMSSIFFVSQCFYFLQLSF